MTSTPAAVSRPGRAAGDPGRGGRGTSPGDRRFADVGDLAAGARRRRCRRAGGVRDLGHAVTPPGDNAVLVLHALTGDSHVVGPAGPGHPTPGLVGRADRSGPPARHRPLVRRRPERARRLPGHHRPVQPTRRTAGRTAAGSRSSPCATRSRPRSRSPTGSGIDALGAGARRVDGRDAGAGVGGHRARAGASGCSCWPRRRTPPATRSPGAPPQLAAIRADPGFRGGDYYERRPGTAAPPGSASRGGSRTPPTASAARARPAVRPAPADRARTRWAAAAATPSSRTWTTTPTSWPTGSTPNSYVVLTEAMNSHDVGRGRGGVAAALARVTARTVGRARSTPTGCTRPRSRRDRRRHPGLRRRCA